MIRRARTAPKTAPGKKPAAIAPAGNEGHETGAAVALETGVTAVPKEVVSFGDELVVVVVPFFDVLLSSKQTFP